jgi:hypothetical protein
MNPLPYKDRPDADHRYWLYSPEGDGFMFFATAAERDDYSKEEIGHYVDSDRGWQEEVEDIIGGVVTHLTKKTVEETKPADYNQMDEDQRDEFWPYSEEFDEIVDYTLEGLP